MKPGRMGLRIAVAATIFLVAGDALTCSGAVSRGALDCVIVNAYIDPRKTGADNKKPK